MASMSAKCRQKFIAGPDTSGEGAGLLELLSHGLAGGPSPPSGGPDRRRLQPRPSPWLSVANRRIGAGQARRYFRGSRL